jgi:transposase
MADQTMDRAARMAQARSLRKQGMLNAEIAKQLGIGLATVVRYVRGTPPVNPRAVAASASAKRAFNPAQLAQRVEKAFDMRLQGLTKSEIARRMDVSPNTVANWINAEIETRIAPKVEPLRVIENARLDYYLTKLSPAIEKGDEKAIGRALQISQRRAALNGLDAPVKYDIAASGPSDADRQVQSLIEEVERNNRIVEAEIVGEVTVTDVEVIP